MSGWIKFSKDMADDPRLIESAKLIADRYHLARKTSGCGGEDLSPGDALRFASNALRGALVTLWCYADEHIRNDDTLPMSSDTLDAFVGIEGFFDIIPRDWVAELDNGTVQLPGYCEKNGLIAKEKRASDNKARQAAWRARNNAGRNGVHNKSVTRNGAVTKCVDLDLDSDRDQDKRSEKNTSASATPTQVDEPEWFSEFKALYPPRAGDQGWRKALKAGQARITEGHLPGELTGGARRYAEFCRSTQKIGTEFVKQAATFLGPDKPFLQSWLPPSTKADIRLAGNLTAAQEFMRRTDPQ